MYSASYHFRLKLRYCQGLEKTKSINKVLRIIDIYINDGTLTVYEFLVQGAVACVE